MIKPFLMPDDENVNSIDTNYLTDNNIMTLSERENIPEWSIEKEWEYKGYKCIITYCHMPVLEDYRCGYVVLNKNISLDTDDINCHGGITFYGYHDRLNLSVIGFDCAHYGDSLDVCTLDFCISECESIVKQLIAFNSEVEE